MINKINKIIVCLLAGLAFLNPGSTGTILALTGLYFFITNSSQRQSRLIISGLGLSAVVLAFWNLIKFFDLVKIAGWPLWLQSRSFTPSGGVLASAAFFLLILPFGFQGRQKQVLRWLFILIILSGLAVSIWQLLTIAKPSFLPYLSGWVIAIEVFKNSPFLGVGPANFLSAFTRFKPDFYNQTPFWDFNFTVSSNYYLQLLTTVGSLGLGAWLFLIGRSFYSLSVILAFILMFFLPINFLFLFTFFCLLAIGSRRLVVKRANLTKKPMVSAVLVSSCLVCAGLIFYLSGRALAAEIYYQKSLTAAEQNLGGQVYQFQIKAIELNPYQSSYRLAYSQTNFALANALAAKGEELTAQERQTISQLIQQAIREAKAAVTLNPASSLAWENLARLYHNLINLAQEADQWALNAYSNTIKLNPNQPNLRLGLGGLYYALNNFEAAADQFKIAASLKPDLANAYYNLAAAYREQKKYAEAYQALQVTLGLVSPEAADWEKVKKELDELASRLQPEEAVTEAKAPLEEVLAEPEPLPSPAMEEPLELPPESGL